MRVCVCATFPLPLSAAPCCLFIRCFAHCSTLSTLATADAFLLNKLQTQLTFHAFFHCHAFAPYFALSSFLLPLPSYSSCLTLLKPTRLSLASFSFLRLHLHFCNLCVVFLSFSPCLMRFLIMYVSFSFPPLPTTLHFFRVAVF